MQRNSELSPSFAAWDMRRPLRLLSRGAAALLLLGFLPLLLAGCGSAPAGTSQSLQASTTSSGSPAQAAPPAGANATVISNIQTRSGNWLSWGQAAPNYVDCTAPCSESSWEEIYGVADPSKSGNATMFDLDPKIPYADALFAAQIIGQNSPQLPDKGHTLLPSLHHFIYDGDFYVVNPDITQSLEFDVSIWMSGVAGMTFGQQCNHLGDGDWDLWDNVNGRWVSAGVPCTFVSGWNHFTFQVERQSDNSLLYQSITLNGTTYPLNITYPAGTSPDGWWGLSTNYQMDSNYEGDSNTTYLDNVSLTYW